MTREDVEVFLEIEVGVHLEHHVAGTQAGVAHFAHLGGALVGFVLIQYWRSQARSPRS